MKKALSVILAAMLILGSTYAFAESTTVPLTLWTFQALHADFYNQMAQAYNAQTKGAQIALDVQVYPYEDMHNKLTIALQTGEGAPDISDIEINKFANYLNGDIQLAPMNDYIEPIKDKLVMERLDNYARDGQYYGIDHHIGACVVFYNVEILEAAGINYKDIKTWDDYAAAGKVVLEKTGKPMTSWEYSDTWSIYPLVSQHGGDWLTADNKVVMDSEVVVNTLQFMVDMFNAGTAVAAPGGGHHKEEYYAWMNGGNCASVIMPFWYTGRFVSYMPDLKGKIKVAAMPTWSDGGYKTAQMGGTGTAVIKTSKNLDVAKDFLAYATLSYEGNLAEWYVLGFDPIRTDVYGTEDMKKTNQYFDYYGDDILDVVSSMLDSVAPTCLTNMYPAAADIVKSEMAYNLFVQGEKPADVAKECAEELRGMIQ